MTTHTHHIAIGVIGMVLAILTGCSGTPEFAQKALGKDVAAHRAAGAEMEEWCPTITTFNVSPQTVECGGEVSLEIVGVTPEETTLSYTWEIEGQSFQTGQRALWKTPTCQAIEEPRPVYTVRGIVSDGECSVTRSVEVNVQCSCAFDVTVNFAFAKANISPATKEQLDLFGQKLQSYPDYSILIEGHTDYVGSNKSNQRLGQRRAEAVKDYLVKQWHVDPSRVITMSFGEDEPVAPNTTPDGRAKNRRAEVFRVFLQAK